MKMRTARSRYATLMAGALVAIAILVAGCGGGGTSSGASGGGNGETVSSGEGEAKAKPGGTLTLADYDEPITLDPFMVSDVLSSHAVTQMFEPLFKANVEGKLEPWLAESMKASPDRKTFTVTIRKGVKFSNGKPMTSADVAFSLETIRKSPVWSIMYELIESVKATGPDTVVIKTSKPAAKLEGRLSLPFAAIVPKNFGGESEEEFTAHPIGTGPFAFTSWKRGESLNFEKNKYYWKPGMPLLDKLVFKMIPDVNSSRLATARRRTRCRRLARLVAAGVDGIRPNLHVGIYKAASSDSLGLNMKKPLFQNDKVREAINLAIDREGIVKAALFEHGETARLVAAAGPRIPRHGDQGAGPGSRQSEGTARRSRQRRRRTDLPADPAEGETFTATVAQIIQPNLEEVGFSVSLRPIDESASASLLPAGKYDASLGSADLEHRRPVRAVVLLACDRSAVHLRGHRNDLKARRRSEHRPERKDPGPEIHRNPGRRRERKGLRHARLPAVHLGDAERRHRLPGRRHQRSVAGRNRIHRMTPTV